MKDIAYCSDKYQYTMGKSFFDSGRQDTIAVFNLFYRKAPENNNWAVVSGTDEVIEMVCSLGDKDASFFEKFLPGPEYAEFREYLAGMKFTGNVYAMREGEIAFPNQPIIIVEAPLVQAQILETPMLCIMNHQMAVATKASRVCRATNRPVSEFGSRRAHGPWAAIYGAKAAIIAGCANTSNILTGAYFGVGSTGTMAHSYVTSYGCTVDGEYTAFDNYIKTHRSEPLIMLIDTYDTLRCGVLNAIRAFRDNGIDDSYPYGYGVRLDSGDLAYLSIEVRRILDEMRPHIHGMVHCTGGAQTKVLHFVGENCRVIKDNMFPVPPLFRAIHEESGTDWSEMYKVFNMGHRMEIYVSPEDAQRVIDISRSFGVDAQVVGHIEEGKRSLLIQSEYGEFNY